MNLLVNGMGLMLKNTDLSNLRLPERKDEGKGWSESSGWTCTHCYI